MGLGEDEVSEGFIEGPCSLTQSIGVRLEGSWRSLDWHDQDVVYAYAFFSNLANHSHES